MPRLTRSAPKYRKHKASGQALVTLSGRDHYLGPHGTDVSKREYDRLVGEWLAAGRQAAPEPEAAGGITVSEVMAAYLTRHVKQHFVKGGRPTSEQACIRCALRDVRRLYGRQPASAFGPLALKAIRDAMVARGLARGTVNQNIGRIRRMFRWAASEELVSADVHVALASVAGLQRGRSEARETAPVLPVQDDVVEQTLKHLAPTVAAMIRLQRASGMRPGEVVVLRPCDVDCSDSVWAYQPKGHKTEHHERERTVFIGPMGQEVLRHFLDCNDSAYCFSPRRTGRIDRWASKLTECNDGPISSGKGERRPGSRYTTDSYRRAVRRACLKAGVEPWSPNQLRHARATEIRSAAGLEAAQVILGHARADVTQVYAERNLTLARSVARDSG